MIALSPASRSTEAREPAAPTVSTVLRWYESHEIRQFSPTALAERRRIWALFDRRYGDLIVADCRPFQLLDFIADFGELSNHTRQRIKSTVCTPFNAAARLGLVAANPFRGVRIPQGRRGRDWTEGEYRALLQASPPHFRRLLVFLRFSGARPGEARAMRWQDIHDSAIVITDHKTAHVSPEPRRIHLNSVVSKLLLWICRHHGPSDHVFLNSLGTPWTRGALCHFMRTIRRRAGVPAAVKLHGGRHTFATHAVINGIDIVTLGQLIGHRSVRSTERYLHLAHHQPHLNAAMDRAIGHARTS